MYGQILQRAGPLLARLAQTNTQSAGGFGALGKTIGMGTAAAGAISNVDSATDASNAFAQPEAPKSSSGDLQRGWVPALMKRMGIDPRASGGGAGGGGGGGWGNGPSGVTPPLYNANGVDISEHNKRPPMPASEGIWDMGAPPPGQFPNAPPAQGQRQGNPFPTPMNGNPFPDPNANAAQGNPFPNPNANGNGFNPHVGNMADMGASEGRFGDGMKARQVFDPATGTMQNDFYSKSFPDFFRPNFG